MLSNTKIEPLSQNQTLSTYWPMLNTHINGFVDWYWNAKEIARFIYAFDDPYADASSSINAERIFLKQCALDTTEINFHPFQSGLIYRVYFDHFFVADSGGALLIKKIVHAEGNYLLSEIKPGMWLYTPQKYLEEARMSTVDYTSSGVKPEIIINLRN